MNYKLDNIPISTYDAIASKKTNYFALEGMFDLPKRIGTTEYDWGTSIEPFVDAEDIRFDGRTLTLYAAVEENRLQDYKNACVACKVLSFDFDSFEVVCKDEIEIEEVGDYCLVTAKLWQNEFNLKPITIIASGSGKYKLDNYNLSRDFGIHVSESIGMNNEAKRIEINTTEFYKKTQYRGMREIELQCSLGGNSFSDMYNKINQFYSVLMAPGMRTLSIGNNNYNLYFKDGVSCNAVTDTIIQFALKGICV